MPRVLVIEDDELVRTNLRRQFEAAGWDVTEAADGNQGLCELEMNPTAFDLVLTDLIMPNKEGMSTIRDVQNMYPAMKVVAMSGGGQAGNVDFLKIAKQLGADLVLQKPFDIEQLIRAAKPIE